MLDEEAPHSAFALLGRVGSLRGISREGLALLATRARRRTFPAGSVLVRQGKATASMHVLVSGCVRVERSHAQFVNPVVLAELTSGDAVGEVGLLEGAPQPVTARALVDTDIIGLSARALATALRRFLSTALPHFAALVTSEPTWRSALSSMQAYAEDATREEWEDGTRTDSSPAASR